MRSLKANTLLRAAAFFALLLPSLPFAFLSAFAVPAYDDYGFAVTALRSGLVRTQTGWYRSISGRYFSTAVLSLGPLTFGSFTGYKIVALLIVLLTFASSFFFITAALGAQVALLNKLCMAALVTSLFSNQTPDVTEAYYWMPGSISYQLGCVLILFFFGLMIMSFRAPRGSARVLLLAAAAVSVFAAVGASETSMIFLLFLVSAATAKAFILGAESRTTWALVLAFGALCALVVFASPGNAARSACCPDRHRLLFSLQMSVAWGARFLSDWVTSPALLLSTILYLPVAGALAERSDLAREHFYLHPLTSLSLLLGVVFLGFFPVYWATGMFYEYRTVNAAYLFFLVGWFVNVSVWVGYLKRKRRVKIPRLPARVYAVGLPVLSAVLMVSNNTRVACADLFTGRARRYEQEVSRRHALFERCVSRGAGDCPAEKIAEMPETTSNSYFELHPEAEQDYWRARMKYPRLRL
ncbi:MAG: hypothetical protein ABR563_20005 [Pyrinomonadaceae bacterium]